MPKEARDVVRRPVGALELGDPVLGSARTALAGVAHVLSDDQLVVAFARRRSSGRFRNRPAQNTKPVHGSSNLCHSAHAGIVSYQSKSIADAGRRSRSRSPHRRRSMSLVLGRDVLKGFEDADFSEREKMRSNVSGCTT